MPNTFTEELVALKNPDERGRIRREQTLRATHTFLQYLLGTTINAIGVLAIFFGGRATMIPDYAGWGIINAIVGILTIVLGTTILLQQEQSRGESR